MGKRYKLQWGGAAVANTFFWIELSPPKKKTHVGGTNFVSYQYTNSAYKNLIELNKQLKHIQYTLCAQCAAKPL